MNEAAEVIEEKSEKKKRDEWQIKDDVRAVKNAIEIFKDKERLEEVQEMIKSKKDTNKSMEMFGDGNLRQALGV